MNIICRLRISYLFSMIHVCGYDLIMFRSSNSTARQPIDGLGNLTTKLEIADTNHANSW